MALITDHSNATYFITVKFDWKMGFKVQAGIAFYLSPVSG
jgi:hypothetical protein